MSPDSGRSAVGTGPKLVLCRKTDIDGHPVAILTLNRPEERNPLDQATLELLRDFLVEFSSDGTRAVVITGAGPAFSAGGDLKAYQGLYRSPRQFSQFLGIFHEVCSLLEQCPAITMAMVNGTCVAGGLELVLACDLVTMGESALIGDGHLQFGQLPGGGGSQRLVRAIGIQRARQWLLSARLFGAEACLEAGLVVGAFPDDRLQAETIALLTPMLSQSALAITRMKELIDIAAHSSLAEGLAKELEIVHRYAVTSHDATEGLLAFAERRDAIYRGT
jgi:enoyl-CoA hydratase/carnithine racemase